MQSAYTLARSKSRVSARYDDSKLIGQSWEAMVSRSKELFRNSFICGSILGAYTSYLTCPMPHSGTDEAQGHFLKWWDHASMRGESLDTVYHQVLTQWIINGDALIIFAHDGIESKIVVVDSSRVRTPDDMQGKGVVHGVKFDKLGRELGYYVARVDAEGNYLLGNSSNFDFYPRKDSATGRPIAWLLRRPDSVSPSSSRGLPIIQNIIAEIEDLSDLSTASVQSAYVKSMLSVLLTSNNPTATADALGAVYDESTGKLVQDGNSLISALETGSVVMAPPGTQATQISSNGNTDLVALFDQVLKNISGAVSIPQEFLISSFRNINFSSSKQSWDRMMRNFNRYHDSLTMWLSEIYRWVVIESMLTNGKEPTESDLICAWSPIKAPDIDPTKTASAKKILLDAGLRTKSSILGEDGLSYRDYLMSLKRERELEIEILGEALQPEAPSPIVINPDPPQAND